MDAPAADVSAARSLVSDPLAEQDEATSAAANSNVKMLIGALLVIAAKRLQSSSPDEPERMLSEGHEADSEPLAAALSLLDEWNANIHGVDRDSVGGIGSPVESLILAATLALRMASNNENPEGFTTAAALSTPSDSSTGHAPMTPTPRPSSGRLVQASIKSLQAALESAFQSSFEASLPSSLRSQGSSLKQDQDPGESAAGSGSNLKSRQCAMLLRWWLNQVEYL
jgi:hypothetical protein